MKRQLSLFIILTLLFTEAFSQCPDPQNFFGYTTGVGKVRLYWNTSNPGAGYSIEYGEEGFAAGTGQVISGSVNDSYVEVDVEGLNAETSYEFRLTETCVNSETSAEVSATVTTMSECPAALYLGTNNTGKGSVRIDWNSFNQGGNYSIEYGPEGFTSGTGETISGQINEEYMNVEVSGLASSTTYEFRLTETCINSETTSLVSNTVTTLSDCPDIPYSLNANNEGPGKIVLHWQTYNTGGTYSIEYGPEGFTAGTGTAVNGSIDNEYMELDISGLASSTAYEFRLTETCANSETTSEVIVIQTTLGSCPEPQYFYAGNQGIGVVEVAWESYNSGGTYSIEYGPQGFTAGSGTTLTGNIDREGMDISITGLDPSTAYEFRLAETCVTTEVTGEVTAIVTTLSECPDVEYFDAENRSPGSVEFSWDSYNVGQTYTLEYGPAGFSAGTGTTVTGLISKSYVELIIKDLQPSTEYEFRLTESCEIGGNTGEVTASVTTLEACPLPTWDGIEFEGSTEIALEWETYNLGQTFTIEYGPAGFTRGTGTTLTGDIGSDDDVFVLISGLSPETTYDFYLSETCEAGGTASLPDKVTGTTVSLVAAPANDACANAIVLSVGSSVSGTNVGSTGGDRPAPCGFVNPQSRGVWYTFTASADQNVKFDLCSGTNTFDTQLEIFTGSCASLTCLKSEDDDDNCDSNDPIVTAQVSNGTTYYLYVAGYDLSESGEFSLSVTEDNSYTPCEGPQNISISPSDMSAQISWENVNSGSDDAYLLVGLPGFDFYNEEGVWSEDEFSSAVRSSLVTGLEPETTYEVYITEFCESLGDYSIEGPVQFTTLGPTAFTPSTSGGVYISNIHGIRIFGVDDLSHDMIRVRSLAGQEIDFSLSGNEIRLNAPEGNMYFIFLDLGDKVITTKVVR